MAASAQGCAGGSCDGGGDSFDVIDEQGRRCMIAGYFALVLGMPAPSPGTGWGGRDGAVGTLIRELGLNPNSHGMVKSVLDDVMWCYLNSVAYDGSRAPRETFAVMVNRGSEEEQIIADAFEDGFSLGMAVENVNHYRRREGKEELTRSAVYGAYLRLNPTITPLKKRSQGSDDRWR